MTVRAGLIGSGIQRSRSPSMHMEEARAQGFDLSYILFDSSDPSITLEGSLDKAQAAGFSGVNITYPFKQAVIDLLDELSDAARAVGAVNTVVLKGGRRVGYNTDCYGYGESFRRGLSDAPRRRVVQIGAGGAGAATAYALLSQGVERLALFDIEPERTAALAARLSEEFGAGAAVPGGDLAAEMAQADGLVHATPVGMANIPGMAIDAALLRPSLWVSEVVYVPLETELLKAARRIGCRTLDGGAMAVFQAAEAFRLFTGVTPDAERMMKRFLEQVSA